MTIRVLLFAALAQHIGVRELSLDIEEGAAVADALRLLEERHPVLRELRGRVATAVNMAYVRPEQRLAAGDELALLPPVSGG